MGSTLNPTQKTHIVWLDVVRLVAMFTVVCCHSADPFNFYPGEPPANIAEIKWWGAVYGSLLRPCVPLFVMITGALLLPVKGGGWLRSIVNASGVCSGLSLFGRSFTIFSHGLQG